MNITPDRLQQMFDDLDALASAHSFVGDDQQVESLRLASEILAALLDDVEVKE